LVRRARPRARSGAGFRQSVQECLNEPQPSLGAVVRKRLSGTTNGTPGSDVVVTRGLNEVHERALGVSRACAYL
jgi:hypothetical protein